MPVFSSLPSGVFTWRGFGSRSARSRLHSVHLLAQVEKRGWKAVGEFVGSDYQDRWGNDRALLLERLRDVFRALPNARIEASGAATRTENGRGYWSAKITITAAGPYADVIEGRVNSLESPFEF